MGDLDEGGENDFGVLVRRELQRLRELIDRRLQLRVVDCAQSERRAHVDNRTQEEGSSRRSSVRRRRRRRKISKYTE
jgi:hypothetical protein